MKSTLFLLAVLTMAFCNAQNNMVMLKSFDALNVSPKTVEDAEAAFRIISDAPIYLKTRKEIANNCENRAKFGNLVLSKLGFNPVNFWIFKEGLIENQEDVGGLEYRPSLPDNRPLFWQYHVASGIVLNNSKGSFDTLVYDPWTQGKLVSLRDWSLSFFGTTQNRTIYVLPVLDNYFYFPTANKKLVTNKAEWSSFVDSDANQMYCGLSGITPNQKCYKKSKRRLINATRVEIDDYLKNKGITP